ncbi:MAG: cation-translocating P-type ATPase [Candidatus Thermoplasmatota archaeon]|nr:cation-translocating P-type ATPase [Candidatus Thermoplasmatota archaeon]
MAPPQRASANERTLQLDLPVLLPEVHDERDPCIQRLIQRVTAKPGVRTAHVTRDEDHDARQGPATGDGQHAEGHDHAHGHPGDHTGREPASLCIHYDPDVLALSEITRIVQDAGAEVTDRYKHATLWIQGMDCADCSMSIEHVLARQEGLLEVSVNYAAERARVEYDAQAIDRARILEVIDAMGYHAHDHPPGEHGHHHDHSHGPLGGLGLPILSGAALALAFFGELLLGFPTFIALPLYILAYLAGGYEAFQHTVAALVNRRLDIEALMVVAALGAAALGHWAEGALLLFLFSLGHGLEHMAMDRARHAINALTDLSPQNARVRRDGEEREVPVGELVRGDLVVVRPGERIPIDGEIEQGTSAVDQAAITGESVPVEKGQGDEVFAGTLNGPNALEVRVTKLARDTTLARVIQMVEEAQTQKSPTQRFSERLERRFAPAILGLTLAVIVVPPLIAWAGPWTGGLAWLDLVSLPWRESLLRGLTLLVAASPCALAISTPAAILSGIGKGARSGVLLKGGVHLENLGGVQAVAFDKTGTITYGRPEVVALHPTDGVSEEKLLKVAASVEARSEHPLARAVVAAARERSVTLDQAGELESHPGKGVVGQLDGEVIVIGNRRLFQARGSHLPTSLEAVIGGFEAEGRTTMVVRQGEAYLGVIALADRARPEARATVARLKELGVEHIVMLTGDNATVARTIAAEVGIEEVLAELLPEQKVQAVQDLVARYGSVAMVGDGVNDAPAMAHATVGVAMGASGTDVALESADVALLGDALDSFPFAYHLSQRTRGVIRQNLFISLGVIALLVPLAVTGLASIAPAIIAHEGSTLVVVANALRLLGPTHP